MKLVIPRTIREEMLRQACAEAPLEACGILAGAGGRVKKLYKMTNVDQSHEHFMMKPAEQFAAARDMRAAGMKMLAVYHSHPASPARPSPEDIRMALTPGVIHVIVSLLNPGCPDINGFIIEDGAITKASIVLEES